VQDVGFGIGNITWRFDTCNTKGQHWTWSASIQCLHSVPADIPRVCSM